MPDAKPIYDMPTKSVLQVQRMTVVCGGFETSLRPTAAVTAANLRQRAAGDAERASRWIAQTDDIAQANVLSDKHRCAVLAPMLGAGFFADDNWIAYGLFKSTNRPTPIAGPMSVAHTIMTNDFAAITLLPRKYAPLTQRMHQTTCDVPGCPSPSLSRHCPS